MFRKKEDKVKPITQATASQMLANVFDACGAEPNTVPLEVLESYSNYRRERYALQRSVLAILLALFLLMPILFLTPEVVVASAKGIPGRPIFEITYSSFLPLRRISAMLNGKKLPVYEMDTGVYPVRPEENGPLEITVTLINEQSTTQSMEVTGVDVTAPELVGSTQEGDKLVIFFRDDSGELDYEGIYAKTAAGEMIAPEAWDPKSMSVTFRFPREALNIFVADRCGNSLQLALTVY